MSERHHSEEAVLARIRRAEGRRKGLLFVLSGLFFALAAGLFLTQGMAAGPRLLVGVAGAVIILAAVVVGLRVSRTPPEASHPAIVTRRSEALQQRRQLVLVMLPLAVLCEVPGAMEAVGGLGHAVAGAPRATDLVKAGALVVLAAFALQAACGSGLFRRYAIVMDDELSRSHRDSARAAGFWTATGALAAAFLAALWRPDLALQALPGLIWAVVAVASGRFLYLDWRAQQDG